MLQKMWKKLLFCSMLICLLSAVCIQVSATEQIQDDMFTYEIADDGTATVTGTVNSYPAGHVEIPSQVNGCPVVAIARRAFEGYSDITSISFPNTLQKIGNNAFDGCVGITAIEIPDSVIQIEEQAFYGCSALNQVSLPDTAIELWRDIFNDTALKNNTANWENGIFYVDNHLIDLSEDYYQYDSCHVRSGTVTIANQALYHASVSSFTLPDGLKRIGDTLLTADLDSLVIPSSVEIIGDSAFNGITCKQLVIEDGVRYIGEEAFQGCSMTEITIPGSVKTVGVRAFYFCSYLEKVTVLDGVKEIQDDAFRNSASLSVFSFPSSLTALGKHIACETPFYRDVHNWKTGLLYIGDCLVEAREDLKGAVVVENGTRLIANDVFSEFSQEITKVTLPESLQYIGDHCFAYSELEEINFPAGLVSIGDYCFVETNIKTAILPDNLTYLGQESFSCCFSLQEVTIPKLLTEIPKSAFERCNIRELSIPGNIKTIGENAFLANGNMEKLTFSEGLTHIGVTAFKDCTSIPEIILPNSLVSLGKEAFADCHKATVLQLSTSLTEIPFQAFYDCSIAELTIPGNIKTICDSAFYSNKELETLILSEGVTVLERKAFTDCYNIDHIELPSTLESVGVSALVTYANRIPSTAIYNGTRAQWEKVAIDEYNGLLKKVTTLDEREPEETESVVETMPMQTYPEETQETGEPTSPFAPGGDNGNSGGSNSTMIIVIVVVVLAAAGVGGWFLLNKKKN